MAGSWDTVDPLDWPTDLVAVHMIHLHTGKVLIWAYGHGHGAPFHTPEAVVWTPPDGPWDAVQNTRTNLFCAGHCQLEDGRAITAGGKLAPLNGDRPAPVDVNIFDPLSVPIEDAWQNGANPPASMGIRRYYPSCTALPDGRIMVFAGQEEVGPPAVFTKTPEVYLPISANEMWSQLTDADLVMPLYPYMFVMPNGHLFFAGRYTDTKELDPVTLTWSDVHVSPNAGGESGSAVMYDIGKVLKSGGNFGAPPAAATKEAAVIDLNDPSPQWSSVPDMNKERRHHNLVALPDGTVLAVGGVKVGQDADRNAGEDPPWPDPEPVFEPEIFNPAGPSWGLLLAPMPSNHPRWYHSTALLLADARVLVAGGNYSVLDEYQTTRSADIFSPPYLDGSPTRCSIDSAPPEVEYGETFQVDVKLEGAIGVDKVSLIRLGAVTHSFDQNQRYIELDFDDVQPPPQDGSQRIDVTPPANANLAPPGYYMLFVLTDVSGVSVPCETAKFIRISDGLEHAYPEDFDVTAGVHFSGALSDLWQSDNQYVTIRAGIVINPPALQIEVESTSPLSSVAELTIRLEASCNFQGEQRIELFNYANDPGQWDQVDTRTATASDSVAEATVTANPNAYIEGGTRKMKARIGWFNPGGPGPSPPEAQVDDVHWSLKP